MHWGDKQVGQGEVVTSLLWVTERMSVLLVKTEKSGESPERFGWKFQMDIAQFISVRMEISDWNSDPMLELG